MDLTNVYTLKACPFCGMARSDVAFRCGTFFLGKSHPKGWFRLNECYESQIKQLKRERDCVIDGLSLEILKRDLELGRLKAAQDAFERGCNN